MPINLAAMRLSRVRLKAPSHLPCSWRFFPGGVHTYLVRDFEVRREEWRRVQVRFRHSWHHRVLQHARQMVCSLPHPDPDVAGGAILLAESFAQCRPNARPPIAGQDCVQMVLPILALFAGHGARNGRRRLRAGPGSSVQVVHSLRDHLRKGLALAGGVPNAGLRPGGRPSDKSGGGAVLRGRSLEEHAVHFFTFPVVDDF